MSTDVPNTSFIHMAENARKLGEESGITTSGSDSLRHSSRTTYARARRTSERHDVMCFVNCDVTNHEAARGSISECTCTCSILNSSVMCIKVVFGTAIGVHIARKKSDSRITQRT